LLATKIEALSRVRLDPYQTHGTKHLIWIKAGLACIRDDLSISYTWPPVAPRATAMGQEGQRERYSCGIGLRLQR
jgi:hypothetical protein